MFAKTIESKTAHRFAAIAFVATVVSGTITTVALAQPTELPAVADPKLASPLLALLQRHSELPLQANAAARARSLKGLSNAFLRVTEGGEVEVTLHAADAIGQTEEQELQDFGATVTARLELPPDLELPPVGMIDVMLPVSLIPIVAELPWVLAVTPPDYAQSDGHPFNSFNSEGVALHNADIAQTFGIDGTGVTVGVISTGVANLAASQALGELPAVTVFRSGSLDEGTAMLEIVHDMAPGATLLYDDGSGTNSNNRLRHVNALNNLRLFGANVIAEDLFFNFEPVFQQGLLVVTAEAIAAAGTSIHSSAGNRARDHAPRVAAVGTGLGPDGTAGPFNNCTVQPTNLVALDGANDTTFDLILGANNALTRGSSFTLQWSEPRNLFPTSGQGGFTNLDLMVMDAGLTQCLGESVGPQANGVGDTWEGVSFPANMAGTQVKLVVNVTGTSTAVAPPTLDLRWVTTQNELDATSSAGSLNPDSNYTGLATSSAAVNAVTGVLEMTSSRGPVQLGATTICPGNGPGPCVGVAGPGLTTTTGPNWTAADGVIISGSGGFGSGICPAGIPGSCRFFGTSAGAPHAAGCDALVRDAIAAPASPVAPITARLAGTARPLIPNTANAVGAGELDCLAAAGPPMALCIGGTVETDPGVCSASGVSVDRGSFDPNDDPIAITQAPPGPYGLGDTQVTLTVTETSPGALQDSCTTVVTVVDLVPPEITAPAVVVAECEGPQGTMVDLGLPVVDDICDASLNVSNDAPALFPLGETTVAWKAADDSGNTAMDLQLVTIEDNLAPVITCNSPAMLSPNQAAVSYTASVEDQCAGPLEAVITGYQCFSFTKKGKRINRSCIAELEGDTITITDTGGVGDMIEWSVTSDDGNGNIGNQTCAVEVVNPNS